MQTAVLCSVKGHTGKDKEVPIWKSGVAQLQSGIEHGKPNPYEAHWANHSL